jgi:hypothetical protein
MIPPCRVKSLARRVEASADFLRQPGGSKPA